AGATCIHPAQVPILNRAFAPTDDEIQAAQTLIERIGGGSTAGPSRRRGVSPRLVLRESTAVYREPPASGGRA
ncbi:hypothetical protein NO135_22020, partial [Clostridioides difficile]|nr:hypothetical protein [Clostridioides difficile]